MASRAALLPSDHRKFAAASTLSTPCADTVRAPQAHHAEFDDELRTHLELETAYNVQRGMTPEHAARADPARALSGD